MCTKPDTFRITDTTKPMEGLYEQSDPGMQKPEIPTLQPITNGCPMTLDTESEEPSLSMLKIFSNYISGYSGAFCKTGDRSTEMMLISA